MATIEDLKADLESYVGSVADIELENSELKKRVAYLESDREHEAKLWMEKLSEGKKSWRKQALQHGRNQKQRTILECEKVMQAFQSEMRTQQFTHQTKDTSKLLSTLLRAENSTEIAEHQRRVYEAMAFTGATKATVTLQDYDIEDNHVSLYNRTDLEVSLIGCSLKFTAARYKFPDDTLIMPNSTLSVWFGKDTHSSIRNARDSGSLYWHSDAAITTDFTSTVDLMDKKGHVFAFVPANEARYLGSEKDGDHFQRHPTGHTRHDHFLRFDHFLRLKNDAFGEPILGHQEPLPLLVPIKREREYDSDAATFSSSSAPSRGMSSRKRARHSTSPSLSIVTSDAPDDPAPAVQDPSTDPKPSGPDAHTTPLSVWNVRALTLSLRPYLHSRNQGCLSFKRVVRRAGPHSSVAICISNSGDKTVDLSGWRLFAMGNPSQELFLPSGCLLGGLSEITLLSALDEDTLLWAQVASAASSESVPAHGEVTPDSDVADRRQSVGLLDESDSPVRHDRARSSSIVEGDRHGDNACSMLDSDVPLGVGLGQGPHIFAVAGLRSLCKGDVLSLHLTDPAGRNICMLSSEDESQEQEQSLGAGLEKESRSLSRGHRTVFGDDGVDQGKYPFVPSPPAMGNIAHVPSAGCSIQ